MEVLEILPGNGAIGTTLGRADPEAGGDALSPTPPAEAAAAEAWALGWARARLAARGRRDYKEADRIRDLLRTAGWQVRDNKDGTVEVRRA
jgi:cysteinyl-tRNA synthetase